LAFGMFFRPLKIDGGLLGQFWGKTPLGNSSGATPTTVQAQFISLARIFHADLRRVESCVAAIGGHNTGGF
jgi:hypothetical protein